MYMLLLAKNEDTLNGCSTHHDNPLEFTCIWYIAFAITYPMLLVDKNWTVIKHTIMIQWCLEYFVKKLLKPCNIEYTSKITDDTRGIALRHRSCHDRYWSVLIGSRELGSPDDGATPSSSEATALDDPRAVLENPKS